MATYTVITDAGSTRGIEAESFDEAAAIWAKNEAIWGKNEPAFGSVDTLDELIEAIEEIEGAWLWIENDETLERHYASPENMS